MRRGITVGVVANEFFEAAINRVGGFGWAARAAVTALARDDTFASPVFLSGVRVDAREAGGTPLLSPTGQWLADSFKAWRERVDILLCIDYRPHYLRWLRAMPRTPVVIWVRDPRTRAAMARLNSLRLPGGSAMPGGIIDWDFQSLGRFMRKTRVLGRQVVLANKMAYMDSMLPDVFGLPASGVVLPNPDVIDYGAPRVAKATHPRIVSLARLDPVKRPWLMLELAQRRPDVEFVMLGQHFVTGEGGWVPSPPPPNVRFLGHVDGQEKRDLLASAWLLVNTSIHEESAVSILEALACGTPVVSFIESDGLSARFGTCLGYDTGSGMASLTRLVGAVDNLLADDARRIVLGEQGRRWVMGEHNTAKFLASFRTICAASGLGDRVGRRPAAGLLPAGALPSSPDS